MYRSPTLPQLPLLAACCCVSLSTACADPDVVVEGSVQRLRVSPQDDGRAVLALDFLATEGVQATGCHDGDLEVTVSATLNGEPIAVPRQVSVHCADAQPADVAMVVDNSRSVRSYLDLIKQASHTLADAAFQHGGRASLVRVSTTAEVRAALTDDAPSLHDAVDALYASNGWTALWDGVRMGHETLGAAYADGPAPAGSFRCDQARKLAVVAFTDGRENNSSAQKLLSDDDDGLDTTVTDLFGMRAGGATTPVYTVGLGREPDHETLRTLAAQSGGRHIPVAAPEDLPLVFEAVGGYADATHQICADLDPQGCGDLEVSLKWDYEAPNGERLKGKRRYNVYLPCDDDPDGGPDASDEPLPIPGESATILLTLSNRGIPSDVASQLAGQAVDYVSRYTDPLVLVVLDDGHHGESRQDAEYVADLLRNRGYTVDYMVEPREGLTDADVRGYDVVWFSNPGYPVDDERSVRTLDAFRLSGGGVVFQGDDIAWAYGRAFSMTPNTGLEFVDNGTRYCGKRTDNDRGHAYTVGLQGGHPMTAGLEGTRFEYGDDIDHTRARVGTRVLAWASAAWGDCEPIPVITVFD